MDIKKIAYERYQLNWMIEHGHSIDELIYMIDEYMCDTEEPLVESYDMWVYDRGFDGEIWVCWDEFMEHEFRDANYMMKLLNHKEYEEYVKEIVQCTMERVE